jgi:MFS family permease
MMNEVMKFKDSPVVYVKKQASNIDIITNNDDYNIDNDDNDVAERITLDQMIDTQIPVGFFHYRLLIVCGLAWAADSMEFSLLSFLSICVGLDWNLSSSQTALISSVVFIGELCGSLWWGRMADTYGRRKTFLMGCSIICIFGFLSGLATSFELLCLCRGLVGFGVGGLFVISDLLAELVPATHRGRYLIYVEYFWTVGSCFVAGLAWILLNSSGWRSLTFATVVPVSISLFFAYFYLPESPRWLMSQRRFSEAESIILAIASTNNTIIAPFHLSYELENGISPTSHWKALISKPMRKITLALLIIWGSFGFTYNGIILFVARAYSNDSNKGTCSFNYSAIMVNAASELFGTLLATLCIDTWGRTRTQTYIYLAAAVSIAFVAFSSSKNILITAAFFARSFIMGASNATWVITPELYPTKIRATGHSICNSMARITAFFVPFLVDSSASNQQICLILGVVSVIATVASSTLPETKNIKLDKSVTDNNNQVIHEYNKL